MKQKLSEQRKQQVNEITDVAHLLVSRFRTGQGVLSPAVIAAGIAAATQIVLTDGERLTQSVTQGEEHND